MLKVDRCFEIVTEESAAHGEAADAGYLAEAEPVGFKALALRILDGGWSCSQSPLPADDAGFANVWLSSEPVQDYRTGDWESESIHFAGDARSLKYWAKVCRLAQARYYYRPY